jgi:myo-inositol 2-dehydrogenase / D-chiro-inositol 1-dehydrogenase
MNAEDSTPSFSRRSFIAGSAATVAAGTVLSPELIQAKAAGDREVKIALVGCGGRGTGATVQALSTYGKVKLWAMADAFEPNLMKSYKSLTAGGTFSRSPNAATPKDRVDVPAERRFIGLDAYRKVLAMPEIDMVILTTPPGFRARQFEEAVKAGKHVFMEKPVATDVHGVRTVLAAAKEAKRKNLKVGVGLNRRHSPMYEAALERIHAGDIGRLNTIRIYNVRGGTGKYYERQPKDTEMEYQVKHWYYFDWLSGDFLVEQSVHDYDVALWMKGMLPVSAQGQGGRLVRSGNDWGNIYDHFYVEYDFPDGSKMLSQHRHIRGCWGLFGEYADGSKGTASIVGKARATVQMHDQADSAWRIKETGNSYQIEHDRLFRAIREDTPHNEAEYGAHATYAAILGRMAAYTGKLLDWKETLASDHKITPDGETWDSPAPFNPLPEGGYQIAKAGVPQQPPRKRG